MKQLQTQAVAELRANAEILRRFDVVSDGSQPASRAVYTLDTEILAWEPGNKAKRMFGLGAGREAAQIRYWLTDANGQRVFEYQETVKSEFFGSKYVPSIGQLAHPLASKLAARLAGTRLP